MKKTPQTNRAQLAAPAQPCLAQPCPLLSFQTWIGRVGRRSRALGTCFPSTGVEGGSKRSGQALLGEPDMEENDNLSKKLRQWALGIFYWETG